MHWLLAACLATALAACQTHAVKPIGSLTAAQVAALTEQGFVAVGDDGMQLNLSGRILFALDSARVEAETREHIAKVARTLLGLGIQTVRLDGHTDNLGAPEYNQSLSLRRAQTVADLMADAGFPREGIGIRGLGQTVPVADNATEEGRSQNRRVSVVVGSFY
ncbi:OmpA family protein [Corticibacter populi]|uniref:OmpA family protein n=1 Tax=Corticibacter populi TaxID=1550736 RepID=A0A3M6QYD9_9BURK|nr:OmpA family protein [Corticibacter populi]